MKPKRRKARRWFVSQFDRFIQEISSSQMLFAYSLHLLSKSRGSIQLKQTRRKEPGKTLLESVQESDIPVQDKKRENNHMHQSSY